MINRVVIVGRLVRDPELRKTPNDSSVVTFTVAVDNRPKSNGEKSTSFIPCTAWNATANNVAKYLKKGSLIGVDGRLNQRQYQSKDGRNVNIVEVIADSVQFLEKKGNGNDSSNMSSPAAEPVDDQPIEGIDTTDDSLPF